MNVVNVVTVIAGLIQRAVERERRMADQDLYFEQSGPAMEAYGLYGDDIPETSTPDPNTPGGKV